MKKLSLSLILFFCMNIVFASSVNNEQAQIKQTTEQWSIALSSKHPQKIVALYADNAYLYATFENMLDNKEQILKYFTKLMKKPNLKVTFNRENIRIFGETAINSGAYTFSYRGEDGEVAVPARYTFVYTHTPNGWLIVEHHSSVLPSQSK